MRAIGDLEDEGWASTNTKMNLTSTYELDLAPGATSQEQSSGDSMEEDESTSRADPYQQFCHTSSNLEHLDSTGYAGSQDNLCPDASDTLFGACGLRDYVVVGIDYGLTTNGVAWSDNFAGSKCYVGITNSLHCYCHPNYAQSRLIFEFPSPKSNDLSFSISGTEPGCNFCGPHLPVMDTIVSDLFALGASREGDDEGKRESTESSADHKEECLWWSISWVILGEKEVLGLKDIDRRKDVSQSNSAKKSLGNCWYSESTQKFKSNCLCVWGRHIHQEVQSTYLCCASRLLQSRRLNDMVEGTGEWLSTNSVLVKWREDHHTPQLWLSGKPGMGKSYLTSQLIENFKRDQRKGEKVAYYYCSDPQGAEVSDTSRIVLAILWEMLAGILSREAGRDDVDGLRQVVIELIQAGDSLSVSRMRYILSKIRHNLETHETLFLFLDGINDLQQNEGQPDLLRTLIGDLSHRDSCHQVKCFISARPTLSMQVALDKALKIDLDTETSSKGDLVIYLQNVFWRSYFPGLSLLSWENYIRLVLVKSEGSILWATVFQQISLISRNLSTLDEVLQSPSTTNLSGLYEYMLGKVEEWRRPVVRSMLRWVTFAARPLYSTELISAMHSQMDTEITIEDVSVLSIGLLKTSNEVSFIHQTVLDYLKSESGDNWQAISDETNEMIARTCLGALSPRLLLESLGLQFYEAGLERELDTELAIQSYAVRNWKFHYSKAEKKSYQLPGLLHSILEQSLRDPECEQILALGRRESKESGPPVYAKVSSINLINTALAVGARFGFLKLAKLELEMGAVVDSSFGPEHLTPLAMAAMTGRSAVVELLLRHGADVHIPSKDGNTPLTYAVSMGHLNVVDLLLAYGKDGRGQSFGASNEALSDSANQELLIETVFSDSCTSCGEVQLDFVFSNISQDCRDREAFPPIHVLGEPWSSYEAQLSATSMHKRSSSSRKGGKAVVKWFPGRKMHKALAMAARRGIEDIRRLLKAAGNDDTAIDGITSLNKLMSNIRVA